MSHIDIRKELHDIIDNADNVALETMYAVFHALMENDDRIVAFTTAGEPLTQQDFIAHVRASYESGKKDGGKNSEALLADIENW